MIIQFLRTAPRWSVVVFCLVIAAAFSPNIVEINGIHNDYEMIWYKSQGFFHTEAADLFGLARPIAGLLTNLPLLPVEKLADYRWTRLFSLLTVCVLGVALMAAAIGPLRIRATDAVAIALAVFLVPSFIYSVLVAAAWAPHLVGILLALWAYAILSRSNVQATSFLTLARLDDWQVLRRQAFRYLRVRNFWMACIVWQLALYDYPPQAMILAVFPVITVLFSTAPLAYRLLIAARDILFISGNVVLYAVTAKLIYIPIARLFVYRYSDAWLNSPNLTAFDVRVADSYRYGFNTDIGEVFERAFDLLRVVGDTWFLPQLQTHIWLSILVGAAVVAAVVQELARRHAQKVRVPAAGERLKLDSLYSKGAAAVVVLFCLVLSASPVLISSGGFVTYRTVAMPIAIASIIALFASRFVFEFAATLMGVANSAKSRLISAVTVVVIAAAFAANFYNNYLTMKLARNEFAYFKGIIRLAVDNGSKLIVMIDPRPFTLPEDNRAIFDQRGRAVPPYELGCFSGYCVQTDAILNMATVELGYSPKRFQFAVLRGQHAIPGLTCAMLQASSDYPIKSTKQAMQTIDQYRSAPLTCVEYSLAWHDVGVDLTAKTAPSLSQ